MSPKLPEINEHDLYEQIFRLSPEAIIVISKSGYVMTANGRVREWLGYPIKDLVGKHLLQLPFLTFKSKEVILKNFLKRITGKTVPDYTAEFLTKDHQIKIGKIRGALIRDKNDKVVADLAMVSEVTEEFFAQEARRKKEQILEAIGYSARYLLKSSSSKTDYQKILKKIGESSQADRVLIVINDLLMQRYEWVNTGVKSVVQDKNYPNLFAAPPEFRSISKKLNDGDYIQGKESDFSPELQKFCVKYSIKSLMIQPIFVKKKLWAYLAVHDCHQERKWEDGELDSLIIAAELMGATLEKNQVEIQLRETIEYWKHEQQKVSEEVQNTQKFKQAVESATDGVMITTTEPRIVYVNPAWEAMTGFAATEAANQNPTVLNWAETKPEIFSQLWQALNDGKSFVTEEVMNTRKDGSMFPVRLSVFPIREKSNNQFYVGLFEDITKRREVDQMKTQFISIASHQLNTPLSAMKWFLELLMSGKAGDLNPKQADYVQNIAGSNTRMIALVRSLLNISRVESGRIIIDPRLTSVKGLIEDVVKELSPQFEKKKQNVVLKVDPKLPKVKLDPRLMSHVFMNLLTNASKYSEDETEITITAQAEGDLLVCHVKDKGYGIPKQYQNRIFEKFFRAPNILKMEADGSGLGLYLVKIVIDSSGGKVWLESEENKGTDFGFSLPLKGVKPKEGEVSLDLQRFV